MGVGLEAYSCSIVNHLLLGQVLFGVLDDLLLVGVLLLGLDVLSLHLLEGGLAQRRGDHLSIQMVMVRVRVRVEERRREGEGWRTSASSATRHISASMSSM